MGRKLYGNKIIPACKYCINVNRSEGSCYCSKKKNILVDPDGKCMRYRYDPLARVPEVMPELPKYSADDFSID